LGAIEIVRSDITRLGYATPGQTEVDSFCCMEYYYMNVISQL